MSYIHNNLLVNPIVTLPHPRGGDSHGQEVLLAPSADNQTHNYDIKCSNHHPSLSTLSSNRLNCCQGKWWTICIQIWIQRIKCFIKNFSFKESIFWLINLFLKDMEYHHYLIVIHVTIIIVSLSSLLPIYHFYYHFHNCHLYLYHYHYHRV